MTAALQLVHPKDELNVKEVLIQTSKFYPEKTIHPDGTVTIEYIETDYFLKMIVGKLISFSTFSNFNHKRMGIKKVKIFYLKPKTRT